MARYRFRRLRSRWPHGRAHQGGSRLARAAPAAPGPARAARSPWPSWRAQEHRTPSLVYALADPLFDRLHGDERFRALFARVHPRADALSVDSPAADPPATLLAAFLRTPFR